MSITFSCPHCHKAYRLNDRYAGQSGTCKVCGTAMRVPGVSVPPPLVETTASGSPSYRYAAPTEPPPIVSEATPFLPQIELHIERTIGPAPFVFHEILSTSVHIDLHVVPPRGEPSSDDHPFGTDHFTVVTSGMSSRPMNVPRGYRGPRYVELMIVLPADWPGMRPDGTFDHDRMKDERNWWPFRWLKQVARLPSTLNTFVGVGHTVPNGEGPDPFADGTGLACMLISLPLLAPRSRQLVVNDNVTVHFLTLVPLYPAEMQLKLDRGFGPLIDLLEPAGVTELIQPNRPDLTAL